MKNRPIALLTALAAATMASSSAASLAAPADVEKFPDPVTVISFVDMDTGEPIEIPAEGNFYLQKDSVEEPFTGEIFDINSNPIRVDSATAYDPNCSYSINLETESGRYCLPELSVTGEGTALTEVTCKLKLITELPKGATRITLYDRDTGELIPSGALKNHTWGFGTDIRWKDDGVPGGWKCTGPIMMVDSNPCDYTADDLAGLYTGSDYFAFLCDDQPEVIVHRNGALDLIFKTKLEVNGNVNGDGRFSVADVVTLQKWILGYDDVNMYDWAEGDYDLDDKLTSFDICLMRQALLEGGKICVEPDRRLTNPSGGIAKTELKMYLGPDESYEPIAVIYRGDSIDELGYMSDNREWMFTEYDGNYGWVKVYDNGKELVDFDYWYAVDKPAIYLYPEEETDVRVELELNGADLATTYPKYNGGWDVVAYPDGRLLNKADGSRHRYLFWDAVNCRARFDLSKGFCVAGCDTESFLKEKLAYMGLNEEETNEFIVYWLPRMERNKYNLIAFQGEAYTDMAKLNITPAPDSTLRVFMAYQPLESAVEIEPQELETFERKGFAVVEWGGSELR